MRTWSNEEVSILKEAYSNTANMELMALLPCKTWIAIYKKAKKMGLSRGPDIELVNRSRANSGANCNFWNGGVYKSAKGYRLIKCPGHHRADKRGYVMEHILVFEQNTGITVPPSCAIHHINGVKDDNRIENLCMMTNGAHSTYHNRHRRGK